MGKTPIIIVILIVKLQAEANCTNGTQSRVTSHIRIVLLINCNYS